MIMFLLNIVIPIVIFLITFLILNLIGKEDKGSNCILSLLITICICTIIQLIVVFDGNYYPTKIVEKHYVEKVDSITGRVTYKIGDIEFNRHCTTTIKNDTIKRPYIITKVIVPKNKKECDYYESIVLEDTLFCK